MKKAATKLRKKYTVKDINRTDIKLLIKAYNLKDDEFLCFGNSYNKLAALDLITDDATISYYGRKLVQYLNFEV